MKTVNLKGERSKVSNFGKWKHLAGKYNFILVYLIKLFLTWFKIRTVQKGKL